MKKVDLLWLGNICRSPAAEAIFKTQVQKAGLSSNFFIDSAGTSAYHQGSPADERMRQFAHKRGYDINSLSRPFTSPKDFNEFDYIITMDQKNHRDVLSVAKTELQSSKVFSMTEFCHIHNVDHVPDPYYQGDEGFELVLDILEDACSGFLKKISTGSET
ncbi:MAG: low molecular weight phosphotyrosine protein phosphatase [Bdellovibrionales bacterium]|nr:low molecular weight phosphotyrosine protein phosphatase [Bdellovibrionales bacterium]